MASTLTLTSAVETINNDGDTAQLILVWTSQSGSGDTPYTFAAKSIRVIDWGKIGWAYDFEDALLVPGTYTITLGDIQGFLATQCFAESEEDYGFTPEVTLKINGTIEYIGLAQEDGMHRDDGPETVTLTFDPSIKVLNDTLIYDDDGNPLNPFSYTDSTMYIMTTILQDIFQKVDSSISYGGGSLVISHDWELWGHHESHNDWIISDFNIAQVYQFSHPLYFDSGMGLSTLADVLRKLAIDWCAFTGMIHKKRAFYKKLFSYNSGNLQTLGRVLNRELGFRYGLIDYVAITTAPGTIDAYTFEQGTDTHMEGRFIKRDAIPGARMSESWTNLGANVTWAGAQNGWYWIYKVKDATIESGAWQNYGEMVAKFWYQNRHSLIHSRVDRLTVQGVGYNGNSYDFLKDFNDSGRKYQPISMEKDIGGNVTTIDGLYLGLV